MRDRLLQLLGIESAEKSLGLFLLTQSFFLGIFYGTFDITAHSLFLSAYDEKSLALAYAVSGFAGIILTVIYMWMKSRLTIKSTTLVNFIFITLITFLLWILLLLAPLKSAVFILLVMFGPLNILSMAGFREFSQVSLNSGQSKNMYRLIDYGLIIGIVAGCFLITVLLLFRLHVYNILIISIISISVVMSNYMLQVKKSIFNAVSSEKVRNTQGLTKFNSGSFERIAVLFIALSVMTLFFIQYSFMAVTRIQYPQARGMAIFLGLFGGSMMLFSFFLRVFVFPVLIRNRGLKFNLVLPPIILAGLIVLAIGMTIIIGFRSVAGQGFIVFFILLALNRFISRSFRESIEPESFNIILQPLDAGLRRQFSLNMQGPVNEIFVLLSGLLLAGLGSLSFMKLMDFSWILLLIISAWLFVSFRLYSAYRKYIRISCLQDTDLQPDTPSGENWEGLSGRVAGIALFKHNYFKLLNGDMSVLEKTNNKWLFEQIIYHTETHQDLCMRLALKEISSIESINEALRHQAARVIDQLEMTGGDPRKLKDPIVLPDDSEKIIDARRILSESKLPQTTEILRLLRDKEIESKRHAIYMIGKFGLTDMIPEVCDCLGIHGLERDSNAVLESFGLEATDKLVKSFLQVSGNIRVSKSIIRLLGNPCVQRGADFLFARLSSNSRLLKEVVITELLRCDCKAKEEDKARLNDLISEVADTIYWNILAQISILNTDNHLLAEIIREDNERWISFLFKILSVTYGFTTAEKLQKNIGTGSTAGAIYALEIADIVIDEELKQKIIVLLDIIRNGRKIRNIKKSYLVEVPEYFQIVEDIINRDYNLTSIWVKASTLRTLEELPGRNLQESVCALLFSPEKILREEASKLIGRIDKKMFHSVSGRIPGEDILFLEKIVAGQIQQEEFIYERTRFLSSVFLNISEEELLQLAEALSCTRDFPSPEFNENRTFILWASGKGNEGITTWILHSDNIVTVKERCTEPEFRYYYLLSIDDIEEFESMFPERSFEIYTYMDKIENGQNL